MHGILIIAKRELKRLRSRFQGESRLTVILLLIVSLGISYLVAQQGFVPSSGLYRIGVAPDGPPIRDSRFDVLAVDPTRGRALLDKGAIDAYVNQQTVLPGRRRKSGYAVGALKEYLERAELTRLADQAELDRAFPLRLTTERVTTTNASLAGRPGSFDLTGDESPVSSEDDHQQGDERDAEAAGSAGSGSGESTPSVSADAADAEVREQIERVRENSGLPGAQIRLAAEERTMIPSLMQPPIPFAQVIIAFLYVLPVSFVSVFFTSSFMDEKTDKRISVLLSAPVTPLQIIAGKMLPYVAFSLVSVVAMTLALGGEILLSLAIFLPVILFIFAIYLMVPLVYRTFRDTTFISMLATTVIISYLVFPAMLSGVSDLAYMSPLTLAVRLYRGESFGLQQYAFSTAPMYLLFALSLYVGTRVLNEEFLMGFRSLYRKILDAIYLSIWHRRLYLSVTLLSAFLVPIVYAVELVMLAISLNLPLRHAVALLLMAAIVVEEIAKSLGIVALLEKGMVRGWRQIIGLSLVSAAGFLIAEKLLLFLSLSVVSQSPLSTLLFSSGMIVLPFFAHFAFTASVCLLKGRWKVRYPFALLAGSVVHLIYNLVVLWVVV
jgi:ABC-type Na+ efflux pump permease subunit